MRERWNSRLWNHFITLVSIYKYSLRKCSLEIRPPTPKCYSHVKQILLCYNPRVHKAEDSLNVTTEPPLCPDVYSHTSFSITYLHTMQKHQSTSSCNNSWSWQTVINSSIPRPYHKPGYNHCLHSHQFPLLLEPVGVSKLSISLWAREILTLSRGVPSSPVSIANIFIFSLKLSFSGRGPERVESNFWCCAASSLVRGSLNTTQIISLVSWATLYLVQYCDINDITTTTNNHTSQHFPDLKLERLQLNNKLLLFQAKPAEINTQVLNKMVMTENT